MFWSYIKKLLSKANTISWNSLKKKKKIALLEPKNTKKKKKRHKVKFKFQVVHQILLPLKTHTSILELKKKLYWCHYSRPCWCNFWGIYFNKIFFSRQKIDIYFFSFSSYQIVFSTKSFFFSIPPAWLSLSLSLSLSPSNENRSKHKVDSFMMKESVENYLCRLICQPL